MLTLLLILVLYDVMKYPIDRLYFNNPMRVLVGIQNTLRDMYHSMDAYPNMWLVNAYYPTIRQEFDHVSQTADKHFFHDMDPWFEKNDAYYYYKAEDFPFLYNLICNIPWIHKETALFAVSDGPLNIPPHRAESNNLLRYHLTMKSDGDCALFTDKGVYRHMEGEAFIFDHSRYHEVVKTGIGTRVVLILDVHRM